VSKSGKKGGERSREPSKNQFDKRSRKRISLASTGRKAGIGFETMRSAWKKKGSATESSSRRRELEKEGPVAFYSPT